jgi:acyl-coenzyme A synthetase/AMP-(fatty) acid ligase
LWSEPRDDCRQRAGAPRTSSTSPSAALSYELIGSIREHVARRIGKLARPKRIIWTDDLPKTRSGRITRRLLRDPDVMKQL